MWDVGKADHIIQHYRSNEAVIYIYSRGRKFMSTQPWGESAGCVGPSRIYSVPLECISWDVYFASPFSGISTVYR